MLHVQNVEKEEMGYLLDESFAPQQRMNFDQPSFLVATRKILRPRPSSKPGQPDLSAREPMQRVFSVC